MVNVADLAVVESSIQPGVVVFFLQLKIKY